MSQGVLPCPEPTPIPRAAPVLLAQQEAHGYLSSVVLLPGEPHSKVFQVLPPPGPYTRPAFPPVQCVLNSSDKGLGSAKCCQARAWMALYVPISAKNCSQWQELVSAATSVGTAPADPIFPPSHLSPTKNNFFPQSCNCPSMSLPYLVGWLLGFLASYGYLA